MTHCLITLWRALSSGFRYEYDGLNLLRMDQLYADDSNGLSETDEWRKSSVGNYRPGSISNLVGKRVYREGYGGYGASDWQVGG